MAEQGSYPLNGRTLQSTDTCTGVMSGQTADIPISVLAAFFATGSGTVSSGTTATRATIVPSFIGQFYFDVTLGFPVWIKQISPAIWVDAAGVPV